MKKPLTQVGDLSIVTDWEGVPRCIIETIGITIIPFSDMTYDICKREGEDDTLESWRAGHINFFANEGRKFYGNFARYIHWHLKFLIAIIKRLCYYNEKQLRRNYEV